MLIPGNALYLWALVPPPDVAARIDKERKEFSENFQSVAALKPPVHLTLYKPFEASIAETDYSIDQFRKLIAAQQPFDVTLRNYGFFERPKSPVAFIYVVPDTALKTLNTGISSLTKKLFGLDDISRQTFNPHFTIGYRDVPPAIFPEVKKAYGQRPFSALFEARKVTLFRHNGSRWIANYELPLSGQVQAQGSLW